MAMTLRGIHNRKMRPLSGTTNMSVSKETNRQNSSNDRREQWQVTTSA